MNSWHRVEGLLKVIVTGSGVLKERAPVSCSIAMDRNNASCTESNKQSVMELNKYDGHVSVGLFWTTADYQTVLCGLRFMSHCVVSSERLLVSTFSNPSAFHSSRWNAVMSDNVVQLAIATTYLPLTSSASCATHATTHPTSSLKSARAKFLLFRFRCVDIKERNCLLLLLRFYRYSARLITLSSTWGMTFAPKFSSRENITLNFLFDFEFDFGTF